MESLNIDDAHIENALKFACAQLDNLQQLVEGDASFWWILPNLQKDYVKPEWMDKLIMQFDDVEFTKQSLATMLREFAEREKLNFGKMMRTLRMLLSYKKDGYQVAEMMEFLGKNGTIQRLDRNGHVMIKQIN